MKSLSDGFPPKWHLEKLCQIADIASGVTKGRNLEGKSVVSVPYMRVANVQDGRIDLSEIKEIDVLSSDIEKYRLLDGDILMTEGGDPDKLGRGGVWRGGVDNCIHQNHVFRVRCDRTEVEPEYLSRFLSTPQARGYFLRAAKQTTGIASINMSQLRELPVWLPPLAEQRRIAAILDHAEALRAKRREALAKIDGLEGSLFTEMFGKLPDQFSKWEIRKIADIFQVKGGKRIPKGEDYSQEKTGFRYLRVTDMQNGGVSIDGLKYISKETHSKISRYIVNTGDIVISIAGSIGLIVPIDASLDGVNLTENAAKLVPIKGKQVDQVYIAKLLRTPFMQNQIGLQVGQATIGKLPLYRIEKLLMPLPPLTVQQEFARQVAAIDRLKAAHQASLAKLDELFASLQHRAFRGELTGAGLAEPEAALAGASV